MGVENTGDWLATRSGTKNGVYHGWHTPFTARKASASLGADCEFRPGNPQGEECIAQLGVPPPRVAALVAHRAYWTGPLARRHSAALPAAEPLCALAAAHRHTD